MIVSLSSGKWECESLSEHLQYRPGITDSPVRLIPRYIYLTLIKITHKISESNHPVNLVFNR